MGEYAVEKRELSVKNFFAGDFPAPSDTGTAGEVLAEYTPVTKNADGAIVAVTVDTIDAIIGITAVAAEAEGPVVYYLTGEFFADALNMPTGLTAEGIKDACRKVSIFLR